MPTIYCHSRRILATLFAWSAACVFLLYLRASFMAGVPKISVLGLSANMMYSFYDGKILDLVQRRHIFKDNKEFTDMVMKRPLEEIVEDFKKRQLHWTSSSDEIRSFVKDNYLPAGSDVTRVTPPDWRPDAVDHLLRSSIDPEFAGWVRDLHQLWKSLGRRPKSLVFEAPRLSSLALPAGVEKNWFLVPGGRFNEFFYWDSYWIFKGLAVSGMAQSMRSMLDIAFAFVNELGYVPNCSRVYCLNRSQPPLLHSLMDTYLAVTDDWEYLRKQYGLLEKEYEWWMAERVVTVLIERKYSYSLNVYSPRAYKPRPESYSDDWTLAGGGATREQLHSDIAAACESGLDFSTRWLADVTDPGSIETSQIVPVDLNAFMYKNERLLSQWARKLGLTDKAELHEKEADIRMSAMSNVFWSDAQGCWFDYHQLKQARVESKFYASNVTPLFADAVHDPESTVPKVLAYLERLGVTRHPGGVPFSLLVNSSLQWDFPNVWAPYQHMMVVGLAKQKSEEARQLAKKLAGDWLKSTMAGWTRSRQMYEKMDCRRVGESGFGGEYEPQVGFGWTNGVVLDFAQRGMRPSSD